MFVLAIHSAFAVAADIPNFDKRISMAAREQPIGDFFGELFGHLGVPIKLDKKIAGTINGDFQGPARTIFRDVERAFQLTMYFDGSKVYIYPSDELSRKIIPMSEQVGKMVLRNAKQMRIGDSLNKAVWSDMGLVVTGTERYRKQIESYTQAIRNRTVAPEQSKSPDEIIKVFKLKYAWADDTTIVSGGQELLVRGVATLLRTVVEAGMVGVEQSPAMQRSRLPRTEQGLRGQGLQSVGQENYADGRSRVDLSTGNQLTKRGSRSSPDIALSGNVSSTRIVADPLNNAIIIRDRPDRMQNYQELIDSLDIEPKMVEIEATIIDMDTDRLRSLGIDWRIQGDEAQVLFGSANATNGLLDPSSITDGLSAFTQNVLDSKTLFLSRIRALEKQKAARIVSKPHVMTLANVEALLDTTSTFFVRVAGREEVDLFNVSVGTTMRVTPHVFDQGGRSQIKLKIDIVDGNQASQEVDGIPVIDESTINTQAIINAGQSLLIGGLVREFKSTGVSKVPVLGSIPGIGALFRNTSKNTSRVERMFLITPRLNTQAAAGKRYSVPILSGSEAQIIESAPSRLEPTLAGLASRDEQFPVRQTLPKGYGDVQLTSPNQALPDPSLYPDPDTAAPPGKTGGSSIRDRLLNNQSPVERVEPIPEPGYKEEVEPGVLVVEAPTPIKKSPLQNQLNMNSNSAGNKSQTYPEASWQQVSKPQSSAIDDADDGWTEIPRNGIQKTSRPIKAKPIKSIVADDGWTEIK